jgi:hypothetical protein
MMYKGARLGAGGGNLTGIAATGVGDINWAAAGA